MIFKSKIFLTGLLKAYLAKGKRKKEWRKKEHEASTYLSISNGGYFEINPLQMVLILLPHNVLWFHFFLLTLFSLISLFTSHFLLLIFPFSLFFSIPKMPVAVAMASWTSGLHSNCTSSTFKSSDNRFPTGVFTKTSIAFQTKCFCLLQRGGRYEFSITRYLNFAFMIYTNNWFLYFFLFYKVSLWNWTKPYDSLLIISCRCEITTRFYAWPDKLCVCFFRIPWWC